MERGDRQDRPGRQGGDPAADRLLRLLEELDRLEDLLEEMDELGVTSREEVERRMAELDGLIDGLPDG